MGQPKGTKKKGESEGATPLRGGRPSKEDIAAILALAGKVPVAEIARQLGRREDTVKSILREHGGATLPAQSQPAVASQPEATQTPRQAIRQELRASEAWRAANAEFSPAEVRSFEETYLSLMEQFSKDGVLASERIQVIEVCRVEILKSRNLVWRRREMERLENIERECEALLAGRHPRELAPEETKEFSSLNKAAAAIRSLDRDCTQEYAVLQQRQEAILKTLKSTRDQRVHEIESGRQTFVGLIKQLQQREIQERESRQAELMRMAAEKELRRLGSEHVYEDGSVDRPILSAETVGWVEEKEGEDGE